MYFLDINNFKALGLIFGAGIGLCVGILTVNLDIWLAIGAGTGLAISAGLSTYVKGKKRDCEVRKSNNN